MPFRANEREIEAILRSPGMREELQRVGNVVADNARSAGIGVGDENGGEDEIALPVDAIVVEKNGQPVALVSITHPSGEAVQAKHGTLTAAAAQAGLKARGGR